MSRADLILATAIILFVAFLVGCFSVWLVNRLVGGGREDVGELDKLARALQQAEAERDRVLADRDHKVGELKNALKQKDAELEAAMDGLRDARTEAGGLRTYIDEMHAGKS